MSAAPENPDVRRLLEILAVHPVLPPAEALPPNNEALQVLLADLNRGEDSPHAGTLRAVSADRSIAPEELCRRAQFVLACLILPPSGNHYEVLGVGPDASTQEIRKRWAALIQRYHPDHLGGGGSGWLDGQARRLIEAYQTLKDPDRRSAYDAQLAAGGVRLPVAVPVKSDSPARRHIGPVRWRWAPAAILAIGIGVAGTWTYTRPGRAPLPSAPLPSAPKLLEPKVSNPPVAALGRGERERVVAAPAPSPSREPTELPSLKDRLATALPPAPPASARGHEGGAQTTSRPPPPIPSAPPTQSTVLPPPEPPPPPPAAAAVPPAPPPAPVTHPAPAPAAVTAAEPPPPSVPTPSPPVITGRSNTPAVPAPVPTSPTAEPLAVVEAFRAAYERKDVRGVMDLFGSDAREGKLAGRAAVEELYGRNFAALGSIRYELSQLDVKPATDGNVMVQGRYRIRATRVAAGAAPLDAAGGIRWLLRHESGALRIVGVEYDAGSFLAPAPAVAATPGVRAVAAVQPAANPPVKPTRPPVPQDEVLGLIERFRAAYEGKDLDAVMGLFTADARDRKVTGRPNVEQLYTQNFAALDGIRYELTNLEVKAAGESEFIANGRYRIRATRAGTPPQSVDTSGSIRWHVRRESGDLRIIGIDYEVGRR